MSKRKRKETGVAMLMERYGTTVTRENYLAFAYVRSFGVACRRWRPELLRGPT
jgi:hypothetical protein